MYSQPGTTGPHGHATVPLYTYYPWHLCYVLTGVGIVPCDTTGMGVHAIILPQNKVVVTDLVATDEDNYFAYPHDKRIIVDDREHIEIFAYTGDAIDIYTPVMSDGAGRIVEWVLDENLYTPCGFSLTLAATACHQWIPIHFHPSGDDAGCANEVTDERQ